MTDNEKIERLRSRCLEKPKAFEDHPWGDTVFKFGPKGKIFCSVGSESPVVTVKASLDEQSALVQHPNIDVAAYVGRHGWVTIWVRDDDTLDIALDWIDRSYNSIAEPKARSISRKPRPSGP